MVASSVVDGDGSPAGADGHGPVSWVLVVAASLVVVVTTVAMGAQAVRGNRTVAVQRDASTARDAALDNAFYHCLDVQTRSLISPGEPVVFDDNLSDLVTMIKGVGSWVTIADPVSSAVARLSLRDGVTTGDRCLGTVVVATYPSRGGHAPVVRVGSGASVPGHGPPPAPPL